MELSHIAVFLLIAQVVSAGSSDKPFRGCEPGDKGRYPHPLHCQMYYDCSLTGQQTPWLEEQVVECGYPFLYDPDAQMCLLFSQVSCGLRHEPFNGCEYKANQCNGPHCRPCVLDFPECKGKSDGPTAIAHKPDSPYYALCVGGRFMGEMTCIQPKTGAPVIFDGKINQCVQIGTV